MEVKITAQLPFSWCQFCNRKDLKTETLIADGEVYESSTICENAPICEACERARAKNITTADPKPEKITWIALDEQGVQSQIEKIQVIGVDMGAGADQTGGIRNGEYLRRVLPGLIDEDLAFLLTFMPCPSCPRREDCERESKKNFSSGERQGSCKESWKRWLKEVVK